MSKVRPTKKQLEILKFIENFIDGNGFGPSYREIMKGLGYKSVSTVANHVDNLIERGHLRKGDNAARSLELVKGGDSSDAPRSYSSSIHSSERQKASSSQLDHTIEMVENLFTLVEQKDVRYPEDINKLIAVVHALEILGHGKAKSYKARITMLAAK